jgi:hypothetical protein
MTQVALRSLVLPEDLVEHGHCDAGASAKAYPEPLVREILTGPLLVFSGPPRPLPGSALGLVVLPGLNPGIVSGLGHGFGSGPRPDLPVAA